MYYRYIVASVLGITIGTIQAAGFLPAPEDSPTSPPTHAAAAAPRHLPDLPDHLPAPVFDPSTADLRELDALDRRGVIEARNALPLYPGAALIAQACTWTNPEACYRLSKRLSAEVHRYHILKLANQAAILGHPQAQVELFLNTQYLSFCTDRGFEPDEKAARVSITDAANTGNLEAQGFLAQAYEQGTYGFPKNISAALPWYRAAAYGGHLESINNYARICTTNGHIREALHCLYSPRHLTYERKQYCHTGIVTLLTDVCGRAASTPALIDSLTSEFLSDATIMHEAHRSLAPLHGILPLIDTRSTALQTGFTTTDAHTCLLGDLRRLVIAYADPYERISRLFRAAIAPAVPVAAIPEPQLPPAVPLTDEELQRLIEYLGIQPQVFWIKPLRLL